MAAWPEPSPTALTRAGAAILTPDEAHRFAAEAVDRRPGPCATNSWGSPRTPSPLPSGSSGPYPIRVLVVPSSGLRGLVSEVLSSEVWSQRFYL